MIDTIHIAVCMKPIEGNFAQNAIEYGVAGLNIDDCRIPSEPIRTIQGGKKCNGGRFGDTSGEEPDRRSVFENTTGRFPANVILDGSEEVTEQFPTSNQNGYRANPSIKRDQHSNQVYGKYQDTYTVGERGYDEGSASRFFKQCTIDEKESYDEDK